MVTVGFGCSIQKQWPLPRDFTSSHALLYLLEDKDTSRLIWEGYKRNFKGNIPPKVIVWTGLIKGVWHQVLPACESCWFGFITCWSWSLLARQF